MKNKEQINFKDPNQLEINFESEKSIEQEKKLIIKNFNVGPAVSASLKKIGQDWYLVDEQINKTAEDKGKKIKVEDWDDFWKKREKQKIYGPYGTRPADYRYQ